MTAHEMQGSAYYFTKLNWASAASVSLKMLCFTQCRLASRSEMWISLAGAGSVRTAGTPGVGAREEAILVAGAALAGMVVQGGILADLAGGTDRCQALFDEFCCVA